MASPSGRLLSLTFVDNQDSHKGGITKMAWFEELGVILSAGKDKSIKFWEVPEYWRDKKIEEQERLEAQIRIETNQMLNFSKQKQKMEEDSDEDDLAGWHLEVC